jgi:hypothetical protein
MYLYIHHLSMYTLSIYISICISIYILYIYIYIYFDSHALTSGAASLSKTPNVRKSKRPLSPSCGCVWSRPPPGVRGRAGAGQTVFHFFYFIFYFFATSYSRVGSAAGGAGAPPSTQCLRGPYVYLCTSTSKASKVKTLVSGAQCALDCDVKWGQLQACQE